MTKFMTLVLAFLIRVEVYGLDTLKAVLVFLYEAEGITVVRGKNRNCSTTNNHFFSELAQRIMKRANRFGPYGRLYEDSTGF